MITSGTYQASEKVSRCSSINYSNSTITLQDNSTYFAIGTNIALLNPFTNYEFCGDQTTKGTIDPTNLTGWGDMYTGGGPIFKVGSTFKWLFYGLSSTPFSNNQIGLATSTDMSTWTVQNSGGVWWSRNLFNATSVIAVGDIGQIDSSYYVNISMTNASTSVAEIKMIYFDQNASSLTIGATLKTNAYSGSVVKIGSYYHLMWMDISTGVPNRNVRVAKSTNLEGPYTDYQVNIPSTTPAGVNWGNTGGPIDSPTIHQVNGKVFGLMGGQGVTGVYSHGLGGVNREHLLLDFDLNTEIWSLDTKGPVLINPLQYNSVYGLYVWAWDHDGQGQCMLVDGSTVYLANSMNAGSNTYAATMTKLKNFK
jgi:hypothetical protein